MSTFASIVSLAAAGGAGKVQMAVAAVIALGVLISFHELGHFLVAKLLKIGVQKFSLGFGPTIVGKKVGETEYVLSWVPLGGYVKMLGENLGDEVDPRESERSFLARPPLQRIAVVVAGPFFNLVLAFLLFAGVFFVRGEPLKADPGSTRVGGVSPGMPAYDAGVRLGDEIAAIDGQRVRGWLDMAEHIQATKGAPFVLTARRGGEALDFRIQARSFEGKGEDGKPRTSYFIGIENAPTEYRELGLFGSVRAGLEETVSYSIAIPVMLASIFQGKVSMQDVSGPLGIAKMAGQQVEQGFARYAHFVGILSVNLGIFNLLPIPILDGGQFLLFLVEWIRRRPLSLRLQEGIQQVGFYVLLGIMVLAVFNDFYNQIRSGRRVVPQPSPSTYSLEEPAPAPSVAPAQP